MNGSAQWSLLVVALILLLQSGSALRCWDCSSKLNSLCGDPMNATEHHATFHIKECQLSSYQSPKPVCRKIVKREYGERIVVRSCSIPNPDEVDITDGACGQSLSTGHNTIESCHICSKDLCNSATSASSMQLLLGSALLFATYGLFASKYNDL